MGKTDLLTIRLNPLDNIVVARVELLAGTEVSAEGVTCRSQIPAGHKIATSAIGPGAPVRKYGQVIGFATHEISPGEHVHTHNLGMGDFARDRELRETPPWGRLRTSWCVIGEPLF